MVYPTLWIGVGNSCSTVSQIIQIPLRFFVFFLLFLVKKTIFNQIINTDPIQGEKILLETVSRIGDNCLQVMRLSFKECQKSLCVCRI